MYMPGGAMAALGGPRTLTVRVPLTLSMVTLRMARPTKRWCMLKVWVSLEGAWREAGEGGGQAGR